MAIMSSADRVEAMRAAVDALFVTPKLTATFDTDELQAAVNTTDQWIDDNQASFNASLPAGNFKGNATVSQKTILFAYVAFERAGLI